MYRILFVTALIIGVLLPVVPAASVPPHSISPSIVLVTAYDPTEQVLRVGSGFIIHRSGLVATCYHVIAQTKGVWVRLPNGLIYQATIVGTDGIHDLAVLKISAPNLTPLRIDPHPSVSYGSEVWAYGFPLSDLGADLVVTRGEITAFRTYKHSRIFQLDMQVNPGSSGGPLIDSNGRVVGVVFSRLDPWIYYILTGTLATGTISFAMPISYLYEIIPGLERYEVFNSSSNTHPLKEPSLQPTKSTNQRPGINWWYVLLGVIALGLALEIVGYAQ